MHENMENSANFLDKSKSYCNWRPLFNKNERIELTDLPITTKYVIPGLAYNNNHIINDGKSISQNIVDSLMNTIEIDRIHYNLLRIAWYRSNFSYQGNPIGLELHLVLNNFRSVNNITFVIPLDLPSNSDNIISTSQEATLDNTNDVTESFANIFYDRNLGDELTGFTSNVHLIKNSKNVNNKKKIVKKNIHNAIRNHNFDTKNDAEYGTGIHNSTIVNDIVKLDYFNSNNKHAHIQNSFPDINFVGNIDDNIQDEIGLFDLNINYNKPYDIEKINLNNLLFDTNQIPTYQCCKESTGPLLQLNFSNLEIILQNNSLFNILKEDNGNTLYITEPFPFDEMIGLYIRNVITDNDVDYVKP
jgi:hypothetical protein